LSGSKRAEDQIAQLNRAQAILTGIDRAIVHLPDRQKLLDQVCRIAVELGGFKLAWVGMIAADGSVQPIAQAGATGYLDGIRVTAGQGPEGCGPSGTAIRLNRPVVIEDADQDPRMSPWHDRLRQFGLRYTAVFPIQVAGNVVGSLQVYAPRPHFFDERELGLLTQMSQDVSFALTAIDHLAASKQAEAALHDANELNQQMLAGAKSGIIVYNRDLKCLICNPAMAKLIGKPAAEVLGDVPPDALSGMRACGVLGRLEQVLAGHPCPDAEILLQFPELDHPIWIFDTTSALHNAKGDIVGTMSIVRDITERKKAKAALHDANELSRQMITDSKDGIVVYSRDLKCLVWNPFMEKLMGKAAAEVIGKHPMEVFPILQADGVLKRLERLLAGDPCPDIEFPLHPPNSDRVVWISDTSTALRNAKGEVTGGMSIVRDITQRKLAEERIVQLSRVQAILAGIDRAIVHINDRQKLLDEVCRVAVAEGGFKLAWVGMVAPDGTVQPVARAGVTAYLEGLRVVIRDEPEGRGAVGRAIREGRQFVVEGADQVPLMAPWHDRLRKFGLRYVAAFPIRISGKIVGSFQVYAPHANFFDENEITLLTQVSNDISFALTAINDLAARKQAEDAMRRSEHNLANFFNEAPIGLVWLSPNGTILRTNQAQLDLLGCAAQDCLGHAFSEFCLDASQAAGLLERLAAKKTVQNFRLDMRSKDGAMRHMLLDADSFLADAVSFWKGNQFRYSAVFVRDITDRVMLEREVMQTGERESRRIAQDLHDGLGQLLAGTAHMAAALQKNLAVKSRPEGRQMNRILKAINEAIAQARDLSRGLHPVEPETNGLMVALQSLAVRIQSLFHVRCLFSCRRAVLIEDNTVATHLFRIAQEAVSNAIKHAKPRRIDIILTATPHRIHLAVRDNGAGMPARLRNKSGMGLRIMRHRAGIINGSLAIQKEPRGGTTILCTIPVPAPGLSKPPAPGRPK
jgi:PAS domain S-box-containing protein